MPTEADFRALLVDAARQRRNRHDPVAAAARRDAIVAQAVIEHPGWAVFHGKLSTALKNRQDEIRAAEHRLAYENLTPHALMSVRLEIRWLAGAIETLTFALTLIPEAVKQGQEAGAGDLA